MKKIYYFFCLVLLSFQLVSQDSYHANLQNQLMTDYGLPAGEFVIADSEAGLQSAAYAWGGSRMDGPVAGQDFSSATTVTIAQVGNNPWDAGFFVQNTQAVDEGDRLLWVFYLRSAGGAEGEVSLIVEEVVSGSYQKEFSLPVPVTQDWQRYFIAIEASLGDHGANGLQFGFHMANQAQVIEIGGFTALNYGTAVAFDDLPNDINADEYDGSAADAPWRSTAADRIETLRKADLRITAQTTDGQPVPDAAIQVSMQSHEFAFGTAVKACRFLDNDCANQTFRETLLDLDGQGHGFNWVVFENDLKWPAWEQDWLATDEQIAAAVTWLRANGVEVRGHALVWPGWGNLPPDMQANAGMTDYLLERINTHLETILNYPGIDGALADWDVINETVSNVDLANTLAGTPGYTTGREVYAEIFELARQHAPEAKLYINDFATLTLNSSPGSGPYETKKAHIQELIDADAPIDGIGFQGHIGGFPNGIPRVLATLDDFYDSFGLEAKITEFDLPGSVDEAVAAQYMGDFLTATFSHPSMTGFLFWSFWDVDTYMNPGSNLYYANWAEKPAHAVFVDKVFNEWWTDESVETDENGETTVRAFKGEYLITYNCGGEAISQTVQLNQDRTLVLECNDFVLNNEEILSDASFQISPNPSNGPITIQHSLSLEASGTITNTLGQVVWSGPLPNQTTALNLDLSPGSYSLLILDGGKGVSKQFIVVR